MCVCVCQCVHVFVCVCVCVSVSLCVLLCGSHRFSGLTMEIVSMSLKTAWCQCDGTFNIFPFSLWSVSLKELLRLVLNGLRVQGNYLTSIGVYIVCWCGHPIVMDPHYKA